MEEMASFWSYQQSIEELKHSLFCTNLELESAQMAALEEKRRNDENITQLLQLLKVAFQERDEAKDQLQMLLNNIMQSNFTELPYVVPNLLPESPPIVPAKGNSSITDSDSLSETYNHTSHVSSPADLHFETITSPDLINMADSSSVVVPNQPFLQEYKVSSSNGIAFGTTHIDPALAVIDQLVMKKPLPEKGKLLQAVMEAGPLLQTLLVAGPLPHWRNPPPLQSLQILPISIKESDSTAKFIQKPYVSSTSTIQSSSPSYQRTCNGASRGCSTSMLNFSSVVSSCRMKRPVLSYGVGDGFVNDPSLMGKRRKFQC